MTVLPIHQIIALTPMQRLRSAGQFESSPVFVMWFFGLAGVFLVALLIVFMCLRYRLYASVKINPRKKQMFFDLARKAGLSKKESAYLFRMAELLCLSDPEDIFESPGGFIEMAAYLWEECLHKQGEQAAEALEIELLCLKQKLQFNAYVESPSSRFSSRQIPVGEEITVIRPLYGRLYESVATVIDNTDAGLQVVMTIEAEISFGQIWQVQVPLGGGTWEFESTAVSYDGTALVLAHSENIRFMRRRSFVRVTVDRNAYIATFPFSCTVNDEGENSPFSSFSESQEPASTENLVLHPARLRQIAGPSLVLEAQVSLEIGDRVLVIFNLDDNENKQASFRRQMSMKSYEKIIRDIGVIKKVQSSKEGVTAHIDLVKLSNHELNELVCATCEASKLTEEVAAASQVPAGEITAVNEVPVDEVTAENEEIADENAAENETPVDEVAEDSTDAELTEEPVLSRGD